MPLPSCGALLLGTTALLALTACPDDDTRTCTAADCSSPETSLLVADESGAPVAARGEHRLSQDGEVGPAQAFDCGPNPDAGVARCVGGTSSVGVRFAPGAVFEVRFLRADGSWSDWQQVPLSLSEHTDPDFNGPGCPCTWYVAAPLSVTVPADARLPAD